ncbi:hypothetical protein MUN82_06180 [Hymenobacter aerilatus]|uniref:Tetratricopeptide repeat protein n=1 Tax=Hymenobacter aerilatus TaxID=2932251 RepID=A0A8T9SWT2_9BACT|nr:hypothetical protein [Hymenobacter aerilatus]UOR06682.1 hypothetical protein MUN82_06180 [Hymenobacter aerilatus]
MTRASLLHILDHVGSISEAENQELVQLATAFPYCQTAHLLLAKAAHDKGSMLASQRLRRAATYAADRQLLRLLIEQPDVLLPAASSALASAQSVQLATPELPLALPSAEMPPTEDQTVASVHVEASAEPVEEVPAATEADAQVGNEVFTTSLPALSDSVPALDIIAEPEMEVAEHTEEVLPTAEETTEAEAVTETAEEVIDEAAPVVVDDLLPATAPPIRPPADAGSSRFEFGLADASLPTPAVYELLDEAPLIEAPTPPAHTVASPPFYADPAVGYGLDLGSRLGASLQPHSEYTTNLPPASSFLPDALLLGHVAAHQPAPRKTLAIIDQFLKNKPRLKAPTAVPPAAEQADLSVPSTSATPALASESLAKIMVKQGKTAKAIEIYERLMVRQPEKKAYFADQIAQLKSSE